MKLLEDLKKWSEYQRVVHPNIDLADFQDPLAMKTSWRPLTQGGFNFKSHKLQAEGEDILAFKSTGQFIILASFIFLMGIATLLVGVLNFDILDGSYSFEAIMTLLAGLVFSLLGAYVYFSGTQPIVFNKRHGYFYKGRKNTARTSDKPLVKCLVNLEEIHAIQLIQEYNPDNRGKAHYSFEINLILNDASRVHVIEHGNQEQIKYDAEVLSDFLKVPLWDVV